MARTVYIAILSVVGFVIFVILVGVLFALSGIYTVAANQPDPGIVNWVLETARDHSVSRHAKSVVVPADFRNPDNVPAGATYFSKVCSLCHGAPGVAREEFADGLNPDPPDLAKAISDLSPAEKFWIVDHGIKMTGMPAFGRSGNESELWNVVAFLQRLPNLSREEYHKLAGSGPGK